MFPNLPTDNLYKFLFIGGLALIVSSIIVLDSISGERKSLYDARFQAQRVYIEKLNNPAVDYSPEALKSDSLIDASSAMSMESELENLGSKEIFFYFTFFAGCIFAVVGINFWEHLQKKQNKMTELEFVKATRQYTECQSCSINLQFIEISQGKIYCRRCHNGFSFTETDLTSAEMIQRVEKKMTADNCTEKAVKKQTAKIPLLYRWNSEFKWD